MRTSASGRGRAAVFAVGVVSANLPDIDLVYTGITPEPLGYLLHHRGHTHTIVGLLAQLAALGALARLPWVRRWLDAGASRAAVWSLMGAGLATHLVMDGWNSYGVHPFWPLDGRWVFGDAVFIFEPWLWLVLGLAAARNAQGRAGRGLVVGLPVLLVGALGAVGVLSPAVLLRLAAGAAAFVAATWRQSARLRAASALAVVVATVVLLFVLAAHVERRVRALAGPGVVDVVRNPNPGGPWCWAVIVVGTEGDSLTLRRGTLSLLPSWQPPGTCATHRLAGLRAAGPAREGLLWADGHQAPLAVLRGMAQANCSVNAWLQFGRAPLLRDGTLLDLRFEAGPRGNFTAMPVPAAAGCPPYVTSWGRPRADVVP